MAELSTLEKLTLAVTVRSMRDKFASESF